MSAPFPPRPTPAQLAVLELVAKGYANKAIAHRLGRSVGCVSHHVNALMAAHGGPRSRVVLALWYASMLGPAQQAAFVATIGAPVAPRGAPVSPRTEARIAASSEIHATG